MKQQSLFDAHESAKARDEAIQRVDDHACPDWKDAAFQAVRNLALTQRSFTTDDVWRVLQMFEMPHEPRALGAVMRRAAALGLIAPTDEHRLTARKAAHRRPLRVWTSLIKRG